MFKSAWLLSGISAFGLLAGTAMAQDAKPMPSPAPAPAPAMSSPVAIGGCNSSCCTSGCTTGCFDNSCGCESQCGQWHPLADVEFMILTPFWNNNPAMTVVNTGTAGADTAIDVKDFGQPDQFVPVIHLGFVNDSGLGARIGWWGFATSKTEGLSSNEIPDGSIRSADPLGLQAGVSAGDGSPLVSQYSLSINVWDFEAIKTFESGNFSGLISGGLRYAHVGMNYNSAELFSDPDEPALDGKPHHFVVSGNDFNGAGLTTALEGRYGRSLYISGTVRGSLLYGAGSQHATLADNHVDGGVEVLDDIQSNYNEVIPVLEGQLGVGFKGNESRAIVPFFELGVDMQAWFDLGNPSRSSTSILTGGTFTNSGFFTGSTNPNATLGLFGFYIRGGLTY